MRGERWWLFYWSFSSMLGPTRFSHSSRRFSMSEICSTSGDERLPERIAELILGCPSGNNSFPRCKRYRCVRTHVKIEIGGAIGSPRSSLLCDFCTIARENLVFLRGSFFAETPLRRYGGPFWLRLRCAIFSCSYLSVHSPSACNGSLSSDPSPGSDCS